MSHATCTVEGCATKHRARGLCEKHYRAARKEGSIPALPSPEERFWAKVNKGEGCWEWTAYRNPNGYGKFGRGGAVYLAHRVSYEMLRGPIPDGMFLDHICQNPACVNPDHLRPATVKQNNEYKSGPAKRNKSSGVRGVHRNGSGWSARVGHNYDFIYLGTYRTIEEAEAVVLAARAEMYTFPETRRKTA